jgi:hypothetical protein
MDDLLRRSCARLLVGLAALGAIASLLPEKVLADAQPPDGEVLAQSGSYAFTRADLEDRLAVDQLPLDTPLSAEERAEAQAKIMARFQRDPAGFSKEAPVLRADLEIVRRGSPYQSEQLAWKIQRSWFSRASSDPGAAFWAGVVTRHNRLDAAAATAGSITLAERDIRNWLRFYTLMLESSLTDDEKSALRAIIIDDFKTNPDPADFVNAPRKAYQLYLTDSPIEIEQHRLAYWDSFLKGARQNPHIAAAMKILTKHSNVLFANDETVIRQPQIDAIVTTYDVIAELVHLPPETAEQEVAFAKDTAAHYPELSEGQKTFFKTAELRWVLIHNLVCAKHDAVAAEVRQKVHGWNDIPAEASALEDEGTAFAIRQMGLVAVNLAQQMIPGAKAAAHEGQIAGIYAGAPNLGNPQDPRTQSRDEDRHEEADEMRRQALLRPQPAIPLSAAVLAGGACY